MGIEHETDPMDIATRVEEADRARAEAAVRGRIPEGDWRVISAKWCQDETCGIRIPDLRRRTIPGVQLCVECAAAAERAARGRGRW